MFEVGGLDSGRGFGEEIFLWRFEWRDGGGLDCFSFEFERSVFGFCNLWMLGVELFSFYGDGELVSGFWGRGVLVSIDGFLGIEG